MQLQLNFIPKISINYVKYLVIFSIDRFQDFKITIFRLKCEHKHFSGSMLFRKTTVCRLSSVYRSIRVHLLFHYLSDNWFTKKFPHKRKISSKNLIKFFWLFFINSYSRNDLPNLLRHFLIFLFLKSECRKVRSRVYLLKRQVLLQILFQLFGKLAWLQTHIGNSSTIPWKISVRDYTRLEMQYKRRNLT